MASISRINCFSVRFYLSFYEHLFCKNVISQSLCIFYQQNSNIFNAWDSYCGLLNTKWLNILNCPPLKDVSCYHDLIEALMWIETNWNNDYILLCSWSETKWLIVNYLIILKYVNFLCDVYLKYIPREYQKHYTNLSTWFFNLILFWVPFYSEINEMKTKNYWVHIQ